jgi:hypothetical protein
MAATPYAHAWGTGDPFIAKIHSTENGAYFNPTLGVRATTTTGGSQTDFLLNPVTGECTYFFGLFRMCARLVAPYITDTVSGVNYGKNPVTGSHYGNDTAQREGFCPDCDNDPNPNGPGNTGAGCPSDWRTNTTSTGYFFTYPYSKAFCPFPLGDPRRRMNISRAMMCVFSDPGDLTDTASPGNAGNQPCNAHTPKDQSANSGCSTGAASTTAMGATAGAAAAVWNSIPLLGQIIATILAILAIFAALYPYVNYEVHGNIGCVEIPPAPNPPPWCTTMGVAFANPSLQPVCATGQVSTPTNMCVTATTPSTFEVPRVRVTLNRQKQRCSNNVTPGNSADCVRFWYGWPMPVSGTITNSTLSICPDMGGCDTSTGSGCPTTACVWKPTLMTLTGPVQVLYQTENGVLRPSAIDAGPYSDVSLDFSTTTPTASLVQLNDPNAAAASTTVKRTFKSFGADPTVTPAGAMNPDQICIAECTTSGTGCASASSYNKIGCVARPPIPQPMVSTPSETTHAMPLLTMRVGNPVRTATLCLTGKCPTSGASNTATVYGKTFTLTAQDASDNIVNAGSDNSYTGATKICLNGYVPTGISLVRTVQQANSDGSTSWVPSMLASDVIITNYTVPNNTCAANSICNCGPDIPSGCNANGSSCRTGVACSPYPGGGCRVLPTEVPSPDMTLIPTPTTCQTRYNTINTGGINTATTPPTMIPAKEALRSKNLSDAGLCVNIPAANIAETSANFLQRCNYSDATNTAGGPAQMVIMVNTGASSPYNYNACYSDRFATLESLYDSDTLTSQAILTNCDGVNNIKNYLSLTQVPYKFLTDPTCKLCSNAPGATIPCLQIDEFRDFAVRCDYAIHYPTAHLGLTAKGISFYSHTAYFTYPSVVACNDFDGLKSVYVNNTINHENIRTYCQGINMISESWSYQQPVAYRFRTDPTCKFCSNLPGAPYPCVAP